MSEVEENSNANQDMGFPRVQNREVQAIYFLSDRFPEENKQILPFINVITAALKWVWNTDETIFKKKTQLLGKKLVSASLVATTNFVRTSPELKPILL